MLALLLVIIRTLNLKPSGQKPETTSGENGWPPSAGDETESQEKLIDDLQAIRSFHISSVLYTSLISAFTRV